MPIMVLLVVDAAKGIDEDVERILGKLARPQGAAAAGAQQGRPRARRSACWSWPPSSTRALPFAATFMISALSGDGVADLKAHLAAHGRRRVPGTTRKTRSPMRRCACWPPRSRARRSTTACTTSCPTRPTVETTAWQEQKNGRPHRADHLRRARQPEAHRARQGRPHDQAALHEARKELTEILEQPVHLFLFVKVRENWGDDPERYRELGLAFPKE